MLNTGVLNAILIHYLAEGDQITGKYAGKVVDPDGTKLLTDDGRTIVAAPWEVRRGMASLVRHVEVVMFEPPDRFEITLTNGRQVVVHFQADREPVIAPADWPLFQRVTQRYVNGLIPLR